MRSQGSAYTVVATVAGLIVLLAICFFWYVGSYYLQIKRGEVVELPKFSTTNPTAATSEFDGVYDVAYEKSPSFGPASAKLTIVEFVDYQCPYSQEVAPALRLLALKYQDKVRFIVRDFPLPTIHPEAFLAAEAAGCADEQGKFWSMYDRLFALQGVLTRPNLDQAARSVGLDSAIFAECLDSHRRLNQIRTDQADGTKAGVVGTPTFFFNGQRVEGAVPQDVFEKLIVAALGA